MRALGIDIGGTSVKAAVVEVEPIDRQATSGAAAPQGGASPGVALGRSGRYAHPDRSALVAAIREAAGAPLQRDSFFAVGLCVPGRRDAAGRTVVASVNVPGLVGLSLDELVAEALGAAAPVTAITSDAHAAALDYALAVPALDSESMPIRLLAICIGTGVGACVLDGLESLRVSGESPGHLGQVDVSVRLHDGSIPVAPDGGRGGLEAYIGVRALVARLGGPAETVVERMTPDDPALLAVARVIRVAHAIYRPHTVAMLGGVGVRLARHSPVLRTLTNDGLTSVARPRWRLGFGFDDFHAARGAAWLAAQALYTRAERT